MDNREERSGPVTDYRAVFESTPDPSLVLDRDFMIVAVNEAYLRATMTTREGMIGRWMFDVFPDNPDDIDATGVSNLRASLNRVLNNKTSDVMALQKYDIRRPLELGDGFEVRYWSPVNAPVMGADGEVEYIVHRVQDVTEFVRARQDGDLANISELRERIVKMEAEIFSKTEEVAAINALLKHANEQLETQNEVVRRGKEEWERTFDSMPDLIAVLDHDDRIVRMNRAMAERIGRPPEQCIGLPCYEAVYGTDCPPAFCDRSETAVIHAGQLKAEVSTIAGHYLITTTPIITPDGSMFASVHVARDISERKEAEQKIERLNTDLAARNAELEQINHQLESFNRMISHDLRQPLNVMGTSFQALQMLCNDQLDEDCRSYIRTAYTRMIGMNNLIEGMLKLSQTSHVEILRQEINLSEMAKGIFAGVRLTEPQRKVTVNIAEDIKAVGDPFLIQSVLENLIGNAWKYTTSVAEAFIEFGATEIDGKTTYFVRDNGKGFDMADTDKLFKPYKRLPGTDHLKGFGIGLSTVARIIERHGGRIWAVAEPDKGATFYFTLSDDSSST